MAPHYLDQIPLDFSNPAVRELRALLSDNYFRSAEVIALVRDVGVAPAMINWDQPMVLVWDDVLSTLQKQARLGDLLQQLINGPDAAVAGRLRELTSAQPVTAAPAPGGTTFPCRGLSPATTSGSSPASTPCSTSGSCSAASNWRRPWSACS